jgi:hypothetical protein
VKADNIDPRDYIELIEIWEASVRATHDFLKEEGILFFKSRLYAITLFLFLSKGAIYQEQWYRWVV